jgi:5-aminolevulinate synthase
MSKALAVQSVRGTAMARSSLGSARPLGFLTPFGQTRSYVNPSKPTNFISTNKKHAKAADVEEVHLKAGIFDTSKGKHWHCHRICSILTVIKASVLMELLQ